MSCSEKDWLLLSRYLANALSSRQSSALVLRISREPELAESLKELQRTRALLSYLPEKQVPHNFTVKAGAKAKKSNPRLFPVFRVASAACTLLFAVALGLSLFRPGLQNAPGALMAMSAASQESVTEDNALQAPAPKAAPVIESTAEATPDLRMAAGAGALTGTMPTPEVTEEIAPVEQPINPVKEAVPWVPVAWALGIVSLALATLTIYIYFQERV